MSIKRILVLCGKSEIPVVKKAFKGMIDYSVDTKAIEDILELGMDAYTKSMIEAINQNPDLYDGIVGTRDEYSVAANIICERTNKSGTSVDSMIKCQNKYISRTTQQQYSPDSTPGFWLDKDYLALSNPTFPVFAKPVRANICYASHKVDSPLLLQELIKNNHGDISMFNSHYLKALELTDTALMELNKETSNHFICEELIASGTQLTVNGYVYNQEVQLYGLVKSVFHADGISFSHHEYPYHLSTDLNNYLERIITKLVQGIGLNNTFFNVEVKVDEDTGSVYVIEVNGRMAFQFAKTIEALTGYPLIRWLADIAVGQRPQKREMAKEFNYCYNFELREFKDQFILKTPSSEDINRIYQLYPEVVIRSLVKPNTKLSDYKQNPKSFRYCMLDIPGYNREDIMKKLEVITSQLGYEFTEPFRDFETASY